MRVRINDEELYDVRFGKRFRADKYGRSKTLLIDTFCTISEVDESRNGSDRYKCVTVGSARLSHKDTYDKYAGKKLAFTRALAFFNKEDRAEFWRIYKENFSGRKLEVNAKI